MFILNIIFQTIVHFGLMCRYNMNILVFYTEKQIHSKWECLCPKQAQLIIMLVRTSRQRLCNQRDCSLLGSMARIYDQGALSGPLLQSGWLSSTPYRNIKQYTDRQTYKKETFIFKKRPRKSLLFNKIKNVLEGHFELQSSFLEFK